MNRFAQSTRGPEWFEGRSCRSAGYRTDYRSRLPQGVPHRIRTFTFSPDPDFEAKLLDIVGLYLNPPENAFVLCVDEKTRIQALNRNQPGLPLRARRPGAWTNEYVR